MNSLNMHLLNACFPIETNWEWFITFSKDEHKLNALYSIFSIKEGMVIVDIYEHPENAELPIYLTDEGIEMCFFEAPPIFFAYCT